MKQDNLGHGKIRFENGQLIDDLSRFWCACGEPAIKRVMDNEPPHDFVCSKHLERG